MIRFYMCCAGVLLTICLFENGIAAPAETGDGIVPRTVLALYSVDQDESLQWSKIHTYAEMPLNHLGIKLTYHNIEEGLPDLDQYPDLLGLLSWYESGTQLDNPEGYIKWAIAAVESGKKLVILGEPGFRSDKAGNPVSMLHINRLLRLLGINDLDEWIDFTYDLETIYKDINLVEFERSYSGFSPSFHRIVSVNANSTPHLTVRKAGLPDTESHMVITSANGGYIADGYAVFIKKGDDREIRQWYINPFEFFRLAFGTEMLPKPDSCTLAGNRIYYSHIDGDGWLNLTQIEDYQKERWLSSKVILEKVIRAYPDLPVTVTAVAAEIDKDWSGNAESADIAREFFKLPQVEMGSHTYSHPFDWGFFADGNSDKEKAYLSKYPGGGWGGNQVANRFLAAITKKEKKDYSYLEAGLSNDGYKIPRAYASLPFDLDLEITGAAEYLNKLAPKGKKVEIVMWTGNTSPFEEAIKQTRISGLTNINGGDSRFDQEYPSYAWVAPVGRTVGNEIQIYSSNSNENTYTELWSGRFHGFRYLKETLDNTEHPIRIKPFNLYYHMYSGERIASLDAVTSNLEYALSQQIVPITTSHYASIAEGFYSTRFIRTGSRKWQIHNRKRLQTIRFDEAQKLAVNFTQSTGVIGQHYYQGSLYIYLDEAITSPEIALSKNTAVYRKTHSHIPYLKQSRWRVWNLKRNNQSVSFQTQGFGTPNMNWVGFQAGSYLIEVTDSDGVIQTLNGIVGEEGHLHINPEKLKNSSVLMNVIFKGT